MRTLEPVEVGITTQGTHLPHTSPTHRAASLDVHVVSGRCMATAWQWSGTTERFAINFVQQDQTNRVHQPHTAMTPLSSVPLSDQVDVFDMEGNSKHQLKLGKYAHSHSHTHTHRHAHQPDKHTARHGPASHVCVRLPETRKLKVRIDKLQFDPTGRYLAIAGIQTANNSGEGVGAPARNNALHTREDTCVCVRVSHPSVYQVSLRCGTCRPRRWVRPKWSSGSLHKTLP